MFATCIFCTHSLGANEAIEAFPVGRRLAFDAAKGRLWVVCPHCERWNLTPLEERWEAIESAERMYRDTKLRVATEHIGLARLPEGLDLVRIGAPQRPEMAAWRYGDQFGRRRRRAIINGLIAVGTAGTAGVILLPFSGFLAGLATGIAGVGGYAGAIRATGGKQGMFAEQWIADGNGSHLLLTVTELMSARLRGGGGMHSDATAAGQPNDWMLTIPYRTRRSSRDRRFWDVLNLPSEGETTLTGPVALDAARKILPYTNGAGAPAGQVQRAVRELEELGGPDRAFGAAAARIREYGAKQAFGDTGALQFLPRSVRLALEMAANEERERQALEGELAELEQVWREAEEVAAIVDDMFVPLGVQDRFDRLLARFGRNTE